MYGMHIIRDLQAAGTPPPADVCGCQNGGTCVVQTRRGREFKRCLCPPTHRGRTCQTERTCKLNVLLACLVLHAHK